MKHISIILATHNRAENLTRTLAALDIVVPREAVEIVLVDNASSDETPRVMAEFAAKRPGVKVLREPRPGRAKALNLGASGATGEIFVWTDDDVVPRPGWLEELVRPIIESGFDATVGRVVLGASLQREWLMPDHLDRLGSYPPSNGACFLIGSSMAVTREAYERTNGYDEELGPGALGYWDDALLGQHLESVGARACFAEKSVLEHHPSPERLRRIELLAAAERSGRSHAYVMHHWEHLDVSYPLLRKWKMQLRLWSLRRRCPPNLDPLSEATDVAELHFTQQIAMYDRYLIELGRPRRYGKKTLRPTGS